MKTSTQLTFLTILLFLSVGLQAQITTDPEFPTPDAAVTIFFDATGTPLEGYSGDVYTHTGITINGSPWQNVIGDWGNNSNQPQLTKTGSNSYELEMTPSIRDFYGAGATDEITEMSFVFRGEDGAPQTADLFVDVFSDELTLVIQEPEFEEVLIQETDSILVEAISPLADSMFVYVEDELVYSLAGISFSMHLPAELLPDLWEPHLIIIRAKNETSEVEESFTAYAIPVNPVAELPAGMVDGVNYIDETSVVVSLYAPLKKFVFLVGEFNDWDINENSLMNATPDGDRYWMQIENLVAGQEYAYQYLVDGLFYNTDPYSEKILDQWNDVYIPEENYPDLKPFPASQEGLVSILQTNQEAYEWVHTDFEPPAKTDLVIYELLIRDFLENQNYQTLIDTLNYLVELGVNAIELMPVNEFDGNISWGYNPNHFFAVDKMYGPANRLKEFIDVCHGHGIAVILDVVYNHATNISPYVRLYFDWESQAPSEDSPFYNVSPMHDFNVFNDMNHESPASRAYISRAVRYWLEEFRVDGYRFDLSKGFTQNYTLGDPNAMADYDQSRIDILTAYADTAWSVNPNAYVILEHFADNDEETVLSNYGLMIWGNSNHNYNEGTMGYNEGSKSDFSWISYQKRGWDDPHVVGYMESHDEERLMAKNLAYGNSSGNYDVQDLNTALKRIQLAAAFFFTIPGPKTFWQFGELGYDIHINYPGDIGGGEHRTDPKPVKWEYTDVWNRKVLYNVFRELIKLKKEQEVFETTDFELSLSGSMKKIHLNHESMNVTVLGNFDVTEGDITPEFQHTGMWYDFFAGDSINVSDVNEIIVLEPGEYRLYTDVKFPRPEIGLSVNEQLDGAVNALQVAPNPNDGNMAFSFELKEKSFVNLRVLNTDGQVVQDFGTLELQAGSHRFNWDGVGRDNNKVRPGIYFCELLEERSRTVAKVVVF